MEGEGNRRTINDKNSEKDSLWGNKKRVGPCSAICSLDFTCSFSIFKCKFQNVCSQTLPEGFVIIFFNYIVLFRISVILCRLHILILLIDLTLSSPKIILNVFPWALSLLLYTFT